MGILKPQRLKRGDLIGLIAPASTPATREKVDKGAAYLESLGYRVRIGRHVMNTYGYLAGTDEERAEDLNAMLRDREVRAIIAVRGGYGTPRLLPLVDYAAVRRDPKIIVGYSDITGLQMALFRRTGLVTLSGPMSAVEMWNGIDPYTEEHFWRLVTSPAKVGRLQNPAGEPLTVLRKGTARGRLIGGNFALVMSAMGTKYMPSLKDTVLLVEDVDEAPHRIDRMFAHLRNAGGFESLAAILTGKFSDCNPSNPSAPFLSVDQILAEVGKNAGCPVVANVQYGHIPKKLTIPFGLTTVVDTRTNRIEVTEGAVS